MKISKLVNKGIQSYGQGRFHEAGELFRKALKIRMPEAERGVVFYNLGLCVYAQKNWAEAEKLFLRSMSLGHVGSGWELGLSQLHQGKLEGFKFFPYRYLGSVQKFPNLPIPRIKNLNDLALCPRLLVLNEQGFGDELLFSRGLQLIQNQDFSYQVYPETLSLFRHWWTGEFFTERSLSYDFVTSHQAWIPAGDLFALYCLETSLHPPLFPVPTDSQGPVGFCFASNPLLKIAAEKSFSADEFKELLVPSGRDLISFQHRITTDFATNLDLTDFLTTYHHLAGLSAVVTVDTSVAHLSALAQVPTYVIYKTHLDWRWILPLYGTHVQPIHIENFKVEHLPGGAEGEIKKNLVNPLDHPNFS
ncbi:tetratricopeptide repeat protein [bacterium]|nr:tetratricopeptide repeat protein [bacterium]